MTTPTKNSNIKYTKLSTSYDTKTYYANLKSTAIPLALMITRFHNGLTLEIPHKLTICCRTRQINNYIPIMKTGLNLNIENFYMS